MAARFSRMGVPLLLLLVWQALSMAGVIPPRILPAPSSVLGTFVRMTGSGELPRHLLVSLGRVAAGLAIGIAIGGTLAVFAGLSRRGETLIDSTVQILRTIPVLGLVPLFILWFGIGEAPKITMVALGTLFPIYINLFAGIRGVDPKLVEVSRSYGLAGWALVRQVVLPGALPSALVGLRYALGVAWLSIIVAEQINADKGLGYLIMDAREFMRTDIIVLCLIVYGLLGLGVDLLIRALERRLLAWRPSFVKP